MLARGSFLLSFALLNYFPAALASNPANCPVDNGQYRTTSSGKFLITCNMRSGRGWMNPKEDVQQDFTSCINSCDAKTGCNGVDYNQDTKSCGYIAQNLVPGIAATTGLGVHNARRAVPPLPPVEPVKPIYPTKPDDPNQKPITDPVVDPIKPPTSDPTYSEKATCGADDGKVYITSDGTAYQVQCSSSAPGTSQIVPSTVEASFAACMEKCSSNNLCNSVQYNARPVTGATPAQGDCILFKESIKATTFKGQYDFAVQIDPPTHDEDDFPNQLCTTACPLADGMIYTSSYGETFKMDCGKRHGTKYLTAAKADNFQDCLEICAAMVPCHSVDYQAGKKKCYLGSHHGNPLIPATSFDSAHSIGCAGACSGGGSCCAGSTDARKSVTKDRPPGPDVSCGNEGFDFALYPNKGKDGNNIVYTAPNNGNFDPVVMKTIQPYYKGPTTKLGVADSASIYGQIPQDKEFVVANHRGYLYAQQTGQYTFSAPTTDDMSLLWVGANAYSGWTRQNANIDQSYAATGVTPQEYKTTLENGKYYPIRFMWANSGGPGHFSFKITAPDGTVVIDDKTTSCPYLVKYGCNGEDNAPPFADWGAEP